MGKIEKKRNSIQRRLKFLQKEKNQALSVRKFRKSIDNHDQKTDAGLQPEMKTDPISKTDHRRNRKTKKVDKKKSRSKEHQLLSHESVDFCERADQPPVLEIVNKPFLKKSKRNYNT